MYLHTVVKLLVCKTVDCEVINVEFINRNLHLNSSAVMIKWKCMKLLYSSKGICRNDSQLKKLICLKYLILETPYIFFSLYSVGILYFYTHLTSYHLRFQALTTATFPFLAFPTFPFLCLILQLYKRKYLFSNIFSIDFILLQVKVFNITLSVLWLPNQFRKHYQIK